MEHEEFIGRVREQAGLSTMGDAEGACRATLETLGERLPEGLSDNLAAQLPRTVGDHLRRPVADAGAGEVFGRADFLASVAERTGVSEPQAALIAHAVVDALFAATEGGLMAEASDYLPPDVREYVTPARTRRGQDEPGQVGYGQAAYGHGTPPRADLPGLARVPEGRGWRTVGRPVVGVRTWIDGWPVYRQVTGADRTGRGLAVKSKGSSRLSPRVRSDEVVKSVCPYCAVGCGQDVYVTDGKVVQIEGDPDSPVSRGRLCPKGSASLQLTTGSARRYQVLYRRPHGTEWEALPLETAMDMIADRVIATRRSGWQWDVDGMRVRRTLGFASLGGATLDNEENYLIKKLFTALGAIQIENQARI